MSDLGHFIGIDWGSTNARALLFASDGKILEERDEPLGIKHVSPGGHRAAFEKLTAGWRERHGPIPALLSGMIGSRTGWREAPYAAAPANLTELYHTLVPAPDVENVWIVPGVSLATTRCDVMRGEELQLLGLGARAAEFDWVCIPGTHSKWIRAEWPFVREFHTAMTGETFAAIAEHTLFAQLIPPVKPGSVWGKPAFQSGLERSAPPHGLLNSLFGIRADLLLGRIQATEVADLISGLVIGTEINHVRALTQVGSRVALLAAPGLQSRYECALAFFDFAPTAFDVRALNADGFRQLMRSRS